MRLQNPALGALDRLSFKRTLLHRRGGEKPFDLHRRAVVRRCEGIRSGASVKPLELERLATGCGSSIEIPDYMGGGRPHLVLHTLFCVCDSLSPHVTRRTGAELHALPGRSYEVASDIPDPAASEVAPDAPDQRMVNLFGIGTHRRRTDPEIPVEMLRNRCKLRHQTATAGFAFAGGEKIDMLNRPQHAGLQQCDSLPVALVRIVLRSHLRDDTGLLRGLTEECRFLHGLGHRLLQEHMLAALHRRRSHGDMVVIRRTHQHGINLIPFRLIHLTPIAVESGLGEFGFRLREVFRIHIAESRHLDHLVCADRIDVRPGAVAATNGHMAKKPVRAAH